VSVAIASSANAGSITQSVALDSGHSMLFDEPEALGGRDEGPSPTEALGACLAACTASTLRLYAARKEWDLSNMRVLVETTYERYRPKAFKVRLELPSNLEQDQIERLHQIAAKCPVHQTIAEAVPIEVV
jgi:putative redox protein